MFILHGRALYLTSLLLMLAACAGPAQMSVMHRPTEDQLHMSDVEAEALIQRMTQGADVSADCIGKCRLFVSHEGIIDSGFQRFPFVSNVTTDAEGLILGRQDAEAIRVPYHSLGDVHVIHRTWLSIDWFGVKIKPEQVIWFDPSPAFKPPNRRRAASLSNALLSLKIARADEPVAEKKFSENLAYYLTASPKPQPTEEMRRYAIQAQLMIREKRFADAANIYAKAIDAAPWWPEARYNRALVLAELKRYRSAIREMERFLKLEPYTQSRRAIQDKIYEWEALARK